MVLGTHSGKTFNLLLHNIILKIFYSNFSILLSFIPKQNLKVTITIYKM